MKAIGTGDLEGPGAERRTFVGREEQQEEEGGRHEDAERAELSGEIGAGAFLDAEGDRLHVGRAVTCGQHLATEDHGHHERDQGDDTHDRDEREV